MIYSVFIGLSSLQEAAVTSNVFQFVEPFAIVNSRNDYSVPIRRLLKLNGLGTFDRYQSLYEWGKITGVTNFTAGEMLKSLESRVIYIEFIRVKGADYMSCKTEYLSGICIRMARRKSGSSVLQLEYYKTGVYYTDLIQSLYAYVILSHWAKETGFNPEAPITFGFTGSWPRHAIELGLLPIANSNNPKSISFLDRTTPIFQVSEYLLWNADVILRQLSNPKIMVSWSVSDHIDSVNASRPGLYKHLDEIGFTIGCQLDSIYAALSDVADQNIIFSFDFLHAKFRLEASPEDRISIYTQRDIIRSMRQKFERISIVSNLMYKKRLAQLDPYKLFDECKETFVYWLDVAIGIQIDIFVSSGGDIEKSIRLMRGSKPTTAVTSNKCVLKTSGNDDQVNMLVHDDSALEKLLADEVKRLGKDSY